MTRNKSKIVLTGWTKLVIRKINRILDADVCVIRSDNERGFGNDLIELCTEVGIIFETLASTTPEQNGLVERVGGTLTPKAHVTRVHANLPKYLGNEMYKLAVYILNRTPNEALK